MTDLNEKTRKQCVDIEQEYERFRVKQFNEYLIPKIFKNSSNENVSKSKRTRRHSHSFDSKTFSVSSMTNQNLFDPISSSIFKTHLTELKSRVHELTSDCASLNEKLHQSEEEKRHLIDRLTQLERQRRDESDSFENELTHCRKLLEKSSYHHGRDVPLTNLYSPPEHDLSLYDEVLFVKKSRANSSSYEPSNYKDLFASVYEKLRVNSRSSNNYSNDR